MNFSFKKIFSILLPVFLLIIIFTPNISFGNMGYVPLQEQTEQSLEQQLAEIDEDIRNLTLPALNERRALTDTEIENLGILQGNRVDIMYQLSVLRGEQEYTRPSVCEFEMPGLFDLFLLGWARIIIAYIINGIAQIVIYVVALVFGIITWVINPPMGFVNFDVVQNLHRIVLNFANIFILLGIFAIAIGTIIGNKTYNYKSLLLKLLIIALLINFSLVITGMFVDISNFFVSYFFMVGGIDGLSSAINTVLDTIFCVYANENTWMAITGAFLILILAVIFLSQAVGILFVAGVRVVTIWLCLIFSPLAFIGYAIPHLEGLYNTWKTQLTSALINLPILVFTLSLVLVFINNIVQRIGALPPAVGAAAIVGRFVELYGYALFMVLLTQGVLMISTMLGAKQMSIGYNKAQKFITGALAKGTNFLKDKTANTVVNSKAWNQIADKYTGSTNKRLYETGQLMKSMTAGSSDRKRLEIYNQNNQNKKESEMRHEMSIYKKDPIKITSYLTKLAEQGKLDYEKDKDFIEIAKKSSTFDSSIQEKIKKSSPELYHEFLNENKLDEGIENIKKDKTKITALKNKVASNNSTFTAEQIENEVDKIIKREAVMELATEQILNSKSEDLRKMNWDDMLNSKRMENDDLDSFYKKLLENNEFSAGKFAAIFSSLKKGEYATFEKFFDSVERKLKTTPIQNATGQNMTAKEYLNSKNFNRNPYLKNHLVSVKTP